MIPRLKPWLGSDEMAAALRPGAEAVARFEDEFARTFGLRHALAFPYGRSALRALFAARGIEGREIIIPAYTCSVVAHAVVLSGNIPRFVDINLDDYTMDLDQLHQAINHRTGAVVPTHLFGYPADVTAVEKTVRGAQQSLGTKILVVQDCAHSFGAEYGGIPVAQAPDAALFGLNISKMITSIFGGILATDDDVIAHQVREFRDRTFVSGGTRRHARQLAYLASIYPAFNRSIYSAVEWLQSSTPLLNRFTTAYHLDDRVEFPPDHEELMGDAEAAVGLVQLAKYPEIVKRRRVNAASYHELLQGVADLQPAPLVPGATYSHYVACTVHRDAIVAALRREGVQLGVLVEYSIPALSAYRRYADRQFPNAAAASRSMINLPVHADVTATDVTRIAALVRRAAEQVAAASAAIK